uniref:Uncharacterized protein n=1 Tax=Heterorhabditis bacteriophora TaxID=37862 RepID=A0A1I7XEP7_HETBA
MKNNKITNISKRNACEQLFPLDRKVITPAAQLHQNRDLWFRYAVDVLHNPPTILLPGLRYYQGRPLRVASDNKLL